MQGGRGVVGRNKRDLIALAVLADRDCDRTLIGADDRGDLLLSDQALGFGTTLLRVALVIGINKANLGTAESRQSRILGERQIEIILVVDDFKRRLVGLLRINALLGAGSGKWIGDADHHFGSLCAACDRHEGCGGSGSEQYIAASYRHCKIPLDRRLSMKRSRPAVKPQRTANAAH